MAGNKKEQDEFYFVESNEWWPDAILNNPQLADFLCPLNGTPMVDPVTAEDGFVYERKAIEAWLITFKKSPKTHEAMGNKLKPNTSVRNAIHQLMNTAKASENGIRWEARGKQTNPRSLAQSAMVSILRAREKPNVPRGVMSAALSKFFKELDPLRELLSSVLDGWSPPKIVVIGDESSGKSTILEQLAMLPIFPRKRRFCTRLAIQVRLRRCPDRQSKATLSVVNKETGNLEGEPINIPLENGFGYVQEEMNKLVEKESIHGIIKDKDIILEVLHPDVPSLDLIDPPGLTAVPEEKRKEIEHILKKQIEDDARTGGHNMYLTIIPAAGDVRPSTNNAMRFVYANNLKDKTIGVFSKCDQVQDFDILKSLVTGSDMDDGDTAESLGAVDLAKGWTATMLKPPAGEYYEVHHYERLWVQHAAETKFFGGENPILKELQQLRVTGIGALVERLEKEYASYLNATWKKGAMKKVLEKLDEKEFELGVLGIVDQANQKDELAAKEVERRLGPDSCMNDLYNRFLTNVLETELRKGLRKVLTKWIGTPEKKNSWNSQDVKSNIQKFEEEVSTLVSTVLKGVKPHFMSEIERAVTAEIQVDGTGSNVSVGTRSIFGSFLNYFQPMPRRAAYKEVKKQPLIQLSHYKDYTDAIVSNASKLFERAVEELECNTQFLIRRFAASDSPWLTLTPETNCASVLVECDSEKFVNAIVVQFLCQVPSANTLKDVHVGVAVGNEKQNAMDKRNALVEEIKKIQAARDGIRRALSIDDEEFEQLQRSLDMDTVSAAASPAEVRPANPAPKAAATAASSSKS